MCLRAANRSCAEHARYPLWPFRCVPAVVQRDLWRAHCLRTLPAVADATAGLPPDTSRVPPHRAAASEPAADAAGAAAARSPPGVHGAGPLPAATPAAGDARRSAFYKKLHYRLTAPQARESLIAAALAASSTDNPQECIANVLSPVSRSRHQACCYWSSAGSTVRRLPACPRARPLAYAPHSPCHPCAAPALPPALLPRQPLRRISPSQHPPHYTWFHPRESRRQYPPPRSVHPSLTPPRPTPRPRRTPTAQRRSPSVWPTRCAW